MRVTITQFRRDLFHLVERAASGEDVAFSYKGIVFRVVPTNQPSKLDRIRAERVVAEDTDWREQSQALLREMEAEWEKDWAGL